MQLSLYNEEHGSELYVMSSDMLVRELKADYEAGFPAPYEVESNQFYIVDETLTPDRDTFDTVEEAVKALKDEDYIVESISGFEDCETVPATKGHHETVEEYWGDMAWSSELDDTATDEENARIYAVYNDEIDDYCQLGTITEIYDEEGDVIEYILNRELIF